MYGGGFYGLLAYSNDWHDDVAPYAIDSNQGGPLYVSLSQQTTTTPVLGSEVPIPKGQRL